MRSSISLKAIGENGAAEEGHGCVVQWSRSERVVRALKTTGGCWGLAAVALFIPGLHFVLVPALLIAGLVAGPVTYAKQEMFESGKAQCPQCRAENEFGRMAVRWPQALQCKSCGAQFYIQDSALPPLISISKR